MIATSLAWAFAPTVVGSLALSIAAPLAFAVPPTEAQEIALWSSDRDERMAWWRDARFGMFIHWGLYSPAGGSWDGKRYEQHYAEWIQNWAAVPCAEYARQMKPRFVPDVGFADQWAELAQAAGMRYAVMTSKHHDGFTLFNSTEPYSLSNDIAGGTNISPAGRDVAREFAEAMRARGLKAGFYYSLLDWQHPDAYEMALPAYPKSGQPRDHARYLAYVRGHVNELLANYGPLSTIWFDYSDQVHQGAAWGAAQLMADMRAKQPPILVNNRLFVGLENKNGDYGTPEKYVPPTGLLGMDWEVNHTLNESYGYSAHDMSWKDTATVVRLLSDIVSKGGNLLLNIGPDAHGRVPEQAERALRGVGAWMAVHGEAIGGTTASPFQRLPWGRATQKSGALYLHVWDWPTDGRLVVPMQGKVRGARLLGSDAVIRAAASEQDAGRLVVELPAQPVDPACSVVRLDLDGDVLPMPFLVFPDASGTLALTPHDATLEGPSIRIERVGVIGDVKHNIGYWLDPAATAAWPIGIGSSQAGMYRVEVDLACADAAAGSLVKLEIEGGAGAPVFTVPATGGWQSYRIVEAGTVELPMGSHRAILRALSKPGEAVANIQSIRLIRVKTP
ncbi:MAG: carbohydrate-binding protein [Phycisphaerae bacterium]|nr:carbohydrate-binding protein [Phycisphaerae bacterium]